MVKLQAERTRHVLHSHEVSYGSGRGSGQQSVTGYPEKDSALSLWVVRAANVSEGKLGVLGSCCTALAGSGAGTITCTPLAAIEVAAALCDWERARAGGIAPCAAFGRALSRQRLRLAPPALPALQCMQGSPISKGQEVRLQHVGTRRWLHSHQFASPLSNNQEVGAGVRR